MTMAIPNLEVSYIYTRSILRWLEDSIEQKSFERLHKATLEGNVQVIEEEIGEALLETISYYDSSESFYHGFMAGIYKRMGRYISESNLEVGKGRPDLLIRYPSIKGKAIIFEFKATKNPFAMEECLQNAILQIQEKEYVQGMQAKGYKDITAFGIVFCGKDCIVKQAYGPGL